MTDEEIIDKVLQYLYDHTHNTAGTQVKLEIFKAHDIVCDKQQYERLYLKIISSGIADKRESMVANDDSLIISRLGIDIIEKHSSYSSFLQSQKNLQAKTATQNTVDRRLNMISIISAIIFGILTAVLGVMTLLDKQELNNRNIQIDSQQHQLDSQQVTIDSLQLILARPDTTLKHKQ